MTLGIGALPALSAPFLRLRHWRAALLFGVLAALLLPAFLASRAHMTSDESLYLAEAYNIAHGHGFTYPSGEAITHRAPLAPLLMAPAVRVFGTDGAYIVSKLFVGLNAVLVMLVAYRLRGGAAAVIAGLAAGASAYVNGFAATLYLDPMQCSFMLLALLAVHEAGSGRSLRWGIAAGAALGLAFLVKESAVQWAPLSALAWLAVPRLRTLDGARAALMGIVAFGAVVAPWWVWVWLQSGELFMLGEPGVQSLLLLSGAMAAVGGFALALDRWHTLAGDVRFVARALAIPAATVLVLTWGGFMLFGLTHYSSWGYPNDYAHTVPDYMTSVATQAQPYALIVVGWAWLGWRAFRRDDAARLIWSAALLFAPFALFTANRGLQLRDALPLVYLSYVVLGIAAADIAALVRRAINDQTGEAIALTGIAVAAGIFVVQQQASFRSENRADAAVGIRADSWDSRFVRDSAAWMEDVLPPGSRVLTSRLYFSSLHVETNARFQIRQMPTVRVDIEPEREGMLVPRANLFRWGDSELREGRPGDDYLYLGQFPGKGYWVGLSQQELLGYIQQHEIEYVVLTGQDVVFSSLSYAGYFMDHPAFTLLRRDRRSASDQFWVFAVDRNKLELREFPLSIAPSSMAALRRETGLSLEELERRIGTQIHVTDREVGLSPAEEWAAAAGGVPQPD